ncbi:ABC transporter permease [Tepidimonas fonticaldi]|uniref:ABC transporter permease n=1 Tax=Tepidimonas fonticaldi TaxID=1101373 RepID=A0A1A6DUV4_9BURK|nr:iron ABC transporter permease [Tepidimonas fonticaldi]OBS30648.1 ABC transporter permease [Tepidimonas fonticaldi]
MNARRAAGVLLALLVAAAGLLVLAVSVGSQGLEPVWTMLASPSDEGQAALAAQIVWEIRLPRALGAWAAGALLGVAGAVAQGLFRNPLADPFLLGSAAGASLAVALALVALGGSAGMLGGGGAPGWSVLSASLWVRLGLTGAAFVGALAAVLLTLALARGVQHTLRLLLAGVVVGVVLGAGTQFVLLLAPDALQAMQAFLLGSTAFVGWSSAGLMLVAAALCTAAATLLARALDALALGEATASSLGVPLPALRLALVAVLALATASAVAQTGLIAFVGLAAPHLVRSLVPTTHGWLMALAAAMGGALLLAADTLARWWLAPQELPVGVLTAVLGGGYLLWLMHRGRLRGQGA